MLYNNKFDRVPGSKAGILLEAGFDATTPFEKLTISSWAYDRAIEHNVIINDNRAIDIKCYHPGYTFVEKLQTITIKFRKEQKNPDAKNKNFMRFSVLLLNENF